MAGVRKRSGVLVRMEPKLHARLLRASRKVPYSANAIMVLALEEYLERVEDGRR